MILPFVLFGVFLVLLGTLVIGGCIYSGKDK